MNARGPAPPVELSGRGARIAHVALTGVFVLLGAGLLFTSATTLRYMAAEGPGPGFVPTWASAIFLAGSIVLHIQSWRGVYSEGRVIRLTLKPALGYLAAMAASILLIPVLGLLGSIFAFFVVAALLVEGCPVWQGLLVGAGLTLALYLLFVQLMRIPLPTGLLPLP